MEVSSESRKTAIMAVVAKEQFHFTQTILGRSQRTLAAQVYNGTALQAVYRRGLAKFSQSDGRTDGGKCAQYEPVKHVLQCVRILLRNVAPIANPQSSCSKGSPS